MQLDSVRELKQLALRRALTDDWGRSLTRSTEFFALAFAAPTRPVPRIEARPQMAIGISPHRNGTEYRLAVRVRSPGPMAARAAEVLQDLARGEIDIRHVGAVRAATGPLRAPLGARCVPLQLGASCAHYRFSAGTLGAFARSNSDDEGKPVPLLLSNNHVLVRLNRERPGDPTLHPSPKDGGNNPADAVASLHKVAKLTTKSNAVDCAVAALEREVAFDPRTIAGLGVLGGVAGYPLDEGIKVHKVGRSSGLTHGRITAFELDNIGVFYQSGQHSFDGQIEVEGLENLPFATVGDSGALVVDSDVQALGLLFAVSQTGGSNGKGLSYINPIQKVLDSLDIRLIF